jgi:hypothetical protein
MGVSNAQGVVSTFAVSKKKTGMMTRGLGLLCLEQMPAAYLCDCSKRSGFRCDLTVIQAIATALDPQHNEFW